MRKSCTALALCLAAGAASALEVSNDKFKVTTPYLDYSNQTLSIVGDDLVYGVNVLLDSGPVNTSFTNQFNFTFTAQSGYEITGYDISYSVRVSVPSCVQPYTLCRRGNASIDPTYGQTLQFSSSFAGNLLAHVEGPSLGPGSFRLQAQAGILCAAGFTCQADPSQGLSFPRSSIAVDRMTITPIMAAAVPEPGTYALSLFGLLILGSWHRRATLRQRVGEPANSR